MKRTAVVPVHPGPHVACVHAYAPHAPGSGTFTDEPGSRTARTRVRPDDSKTLRCRTFDSRPLITGARVRPNGRRQPVDRPVDDQTRARTIRALRPVKVGPRIMRARMCVQDGAR